MVKARTRKARTRKSITRKQSGGEDHPLHKAIERYDNYKFKAYVNSGEYDLNEVNIIGDTPMMTACRYRRTHMILYLLNKGASPEGINVFGQTNLHIAAWISDPEILEILLPKLPQYLNTKDETGNTPLMIAVGTKQFLNVKLLIRQPGIDFLIRNERGQTVFDIETSNEIKKILKNIKKRVLPNIPRVVSYEKTPLKVPAGAENEVSYLPIEEGENLVDFHNEATHGRFYKKNTFNAFPTPRLNPFTRRPILDSNIKYHTAQINSS